MTDNHNHIPGGVIYTTEHFQLMVKRCRLCDAFLGVESASRKEDIPKPPPAEPGSYFDQTV